ncbi:MAG: zinc ribbon domain-containing protein [Desulfocapsaceae bacterium]
MRTDYRRYFENIPVCPHCDEELSCCESPQIHVGDGLGWGSEVLYICLNDNCSLFINGWAQIEEKYGHNSSYRYMQLPGSSEANLMMVGSEDAFKGSVIDLQAVEAQNVRYQKEKEALAALETAIEKNNLEPALHLILDEAAAIDGRREAISMLVSINDLACIDPIRNHKFRDTSLQSECMMAISLLLKANYKKECPYCYELIKSQAKVCMHCKKEL